LLFSEVKSLTIGLQNCCTSIQNLVLRHVDLHGDIMADFSALLSQCTALKVLQLIECNINPEDTKVLAVGLENRSLELLDLSYNKIGFTGMQSLAISIHCKELMLTSCNIGSEGAVYLAEYLSQKPIITTLYFSDNDIKSRGIIALAEGLSHCFNLQKLSISCNEVGYDGAVALAQGLKSCSNLLCVDLCQCHLCDGELFSITDPFDWNKMMHLDLSNNGILSDSILSALTKGMKHLSMLRSLFLSNSNIDNRAALTLAEGIVLSFSLYSSFV